MTTDTSGAPHKAGEPKLYVMYDAAKPEAGKLYFTEAEWDAFVLGVKDGEFDLDENGNLPPVPADQQAAGSSRSGNGAAAARCRGRQALVLTVWYRPIRSGYHAFMSPRARRPVLDSARFGRTPVLFLLGLAACCLIAIVALVLVVAQRGPAPTLVGLLLALLPFPLLVALILYLDRLEPEPRALLAAIFGAGAGIAVITALLGRALHTGVITTPDSSRTRASRPRSRLARRSAARLSRSHSTGWSCWPCSPRAAPRSTALRTAWSTGPWSGSASRSWPTCTPTPWPGTPARARWPRSSLGAASSARSFRRCSPR